MEAERMSLEEYRRRISNGQLFTLVDVRNPVAWGESNVMLPGAIRVELQNPEPGVSRIPEGFPVLAYCT